MANDLWLECPIDCTEDHSDHGLIQRYIHLTRQFEAPTSFHVFALLTIVAAVTGRRVVIDRGGYRLWPNLYTLLHGPSGLGKGVATGHAMSIVSEAAEIERYPEDLSAEGLFRLMWEQTQEGRPAMGLVVSDEFGELLGGQDYKRDVAKRLTRLYSCPAMYDVGRAGTGRRVAERVFLSILANSQEDWLRTLPLDAIKGGLFARIITVPETRRRFRRFYPAVDMKAGASLIEDLKDRLEGLRPGIVTMDPKAFERSREWYEGGEDERWKDLDPIVYPWCERRMDHAMKLAYLNTILEGDSGDPLIIDEEGIAWGLDAVEWLTPRIQAAFQRMNETRVGEMHREMLSMVRQQRDMSERVVRAGLGNRYSKGRIDEGFFHLVSAGQVERYQAVDRDGRADWRVRVADNGTEPVGRIERQGSTGTSTKEPGRDRDADSHRERDVPAADTGDDTDPGGARTEEGEG